jgi:hypothetical protein
VVALAYGGNPSFLRYEERKAGINLGWSEAPVFEWTIAGGKRGEPVRVGERVALFNEREGDCLIHFDRTVGGDIGWPTSPGFDDHAGKAAKKVGKKLVDFLF